MSTTEFSLNSSRTGSTTPGAGPLRPFADPEAETRLAAVDPSWAWAPYQPAADRPWNIRLAAHLHRRAGFGASWPDLQRAVARGPAAAVDALLHPPESAAAFATTADEYEQAAARTGDAASLTAWWLWRLLGTPDPLREKLALFWHQHFAIGAAAAVDLTVYHRHLQDLRTEALGGLTGLFGKVMENPAMYTALGGDQNRRAQPNVAFARLWLDTFTLGPRIASDGDAAEAARCFAGWFVYNGKLRFIEREQDTGGKTILGQTGPFTRDGLVELLLEHPATGRHLAGKLFRWLISESAPPPDRLIEPVAHLLRQRQGIRLAVERVLRSNLFFSEHALWQKIKSPVELAVGLARGLEGRLPAGPLARDLANLGQRLDEPPTVQGWSGGVDWINSVTIAARLELCHAMLEGIHGHGKGLDPAAVAARHGQTTPADAARLWVDVLLPDQLPPATRDRIVGLADGTSSPPDRLRPVVAAIISQPEFQLC